jgi:hypothetical protein
MLFPVSKFSSLPWGSGLIRGGGGFLGFEYVFLKWWCWIGTPRRSRFLSGFFVSALLVDGHAGVVFRSVFVVDCSSGGLGFRLERRFRAWRGSVLGGSSSPVTWSFPRSTLPPSPVKRPNFWFRSGLSDRSGESKRGKWGKWSASAFAIVFSLFLFGGCWMQLLGCICNTRI